MLKAINIKWDTDGDMEVLANADAVCMRNSSVAVVLSTGR